MYITLSQNSVAPAWRMGSKKKSFSATITERVSIPLDAGLWSGGNRYVYYTLGLDTGLLDLVEGQAQFSPKGCQAGTIDLRPGFAVVRVMEGYKPVGPHYYVCGADAKQMGWA